jgi:metal-responsive CopG/Arc/MetJ family transcriptional regulator
MDAPSSSSPEARTRNARRNVTLSLPKDLLKQAKVFAARNDVSLSDLLRASLENKICEDSDYRRAQHRQLGLMESGLDLGTRGRIALSRDEIHDRD